MTINITGTLVPASSTFGIANASDLVGGSAQYASETTIGAINSARLLVGQKAYSQASGIEYILVSLTPGGGFANGTWTTTIVPSGGAWVAAVLVATTNRTLSGEQTIDGTLTNGTRVLLTGQTTQSENGLYITASGAWARASDANLSSQFVTGKTVAVSSGSTLAGSIWVYSGANLPTLGTSAITFAENANSGGTVNLSSPPPIGDVAPNTVAATAATVRTLAFASGYAPSLQEIITTGGGNADYALTGAEYCAGHITFHGTLTANRIRGLPTTPGASWDVENQTSGGYSILLQAWDGGSYTGSQIVLPSGQMKRVAYSSDGFTLVETSGSSGTTDATTHTSSFTMNASDVNVLVNSTSAPLTATLPPSPTKGMRRLIKDDGMAIETNAVTISSGSSAKVQNAQTNDMSSTSFVFDKATSGYRNGSAVEFLFDGTNWVSLR